MVATRCPQCQLLLTNDEWQTGACPVCEAALSAPAGPPPKETNATEPPHSGRGFLLSGGAVMLLLAGGLIGYLLREGTLQAGDAQPSRDEASLERQEELEALNAKLNRWLTSREKQAADAKAAADAARRELEQARKATDDRVGELEGIATRLKKDLAESKAREAAAGRDADMARTAAPPPSLRDNKEVGLLIKRLNEDLAAQKRLTLVGKTREEALRREIEQVRRDGQRNLDQVRREGQQALALAQRQSQQATEQARRDGQRALEQVRQQLLKQQQATQQARADAEKFKRAAEEAKRKSK